MAKRTGMMKIIDVHTVSSVDDGSEKLERIHEKMLRMAYEQGIRTIIATPLPSGTRYRD